MIYGRKNSSDIELLRRVCRGCISSARLPIIVISLVEGDEYILNKSSFAHPTTVDSSHKGYWERSEAVTAMILQSDCRKAFALLLLRVHLE